MQTCKLQMTGNLPTNSGMRPYWTKSVCSTSFSRCDMAEAFQESCSFALQAKIIVSEMDATFFHMPDKKDVDLECHLILHPSQKL